MSDYMVMIDSSAWIDSFRGKTPAVTATVRALLENNQAVTCGPILMELYRGLKAGERKKLAPLLSAVNRVAFQEDDWEAAGELDGRLRAGGVTVPPVDIIIARLCLRTGATLFTLDGHFRKIPGLKFFDSM